MWSEVIRLEGKRTQQNGMLSSGNNCDTPSTFQIAAETASYKGPDSWIRVFQFQLASEDEHHWRESCTKGGIPS